MMQSQNVSYPGTPNTIQTTVMVTPNRTTGSSMMQGRREYALSLGPLPVTYASPGDDGYITYQRNDQEHFQFAVRIGAIVSETILHSQPGLISSQAASEISGVAMAPMLARMQAHPDGV